MIKQTFSVLLSTAMIASLSGCEISDRSATDSVIDSLIGGSSEAGSESLASGSENEEKNTVITSKTAEPNGEVLDLRELSPTVVYSEVFAMMNEPDDYIGKTIIASGPFSYYKDDSNGQEYFAVIVKDATACCAQGIEFELEGNNSYPEDYPGVNDEITVEGLFSCYTDNTGTYVQLTNAKFI